MPAFSRPVHLPARPQHTTEYFSNADHATIYGSSFGGIHNSIIQSAKKDGFQILQEHVAASAFHNSKERRDPPRCHEHTREAVLNEIFEWIVGNVGRETWIVWLNGAAGAGKSAISQSIAERCILQGILVASFFFFRTDKYRNTIDRLVATLAYQIIQLLPETKNHIVEAIESNPLVFEQTFETQLNLLVVQPLRLLQVSDPTLTVLLIVDGVDECDKHDTQMSLIRAIAKLLRSEHVPLIVLFGSRRENQLLMAFDSREMTGILKQLPLDDNYHSDKDIRRFLDDSFEEIKQMHPFRTWLAADWPSPDHVQEIVVKSSGQFIYASVVIKFLLSPSAHPSIRLDIIRGIRPTGRLTPFAELDALYRHIFSQVDDLPPILEFLAYWILGRKYSLLSALCFLGLRAHEVEIMFIPLASVMICDVKADKFTFHHTSPPDFLRDETRSGAYCINTLATPLSIRWFKIAELGCFYKGLDYAISNLIEHAEPTAELYKSLLLYTPSQSHSAYERRMLGKKFLTAINNMDFGDDKTAYNKLLNMIVHHVYYNKLPQALSEIAEEHDVSQIVDQLASEEGTDLDLEDGMDLSTSTGRASAPPEETLRTVLLPLAFTDNGEAPHTPLLSQYNDARKRGNLSMAADSPHIPSANNPPLPTPSLRQPSRTNTLRHQSGFPDVVPEDHDLIYYRDIDTSIQSSALNFNFLDNFNLNRESNLILDRFLELYPE